MRLLGSSLTVLACLLATCYAEVDEAAARGVGGAGAPGSKLPRMRPGGRPGGRNQYRMSYQAPDDERPARQQQPVQQAARQQPRPAQAQRQVRKRPGQPPLEQQRRRPQPQQQTRQARRPAPAQQVVVRARRPQERGGVVRRRKQEAAEELGHEDDIIMADRGRAVAQPQRRRRPRVGDDGDEYRGAPPRRVFRNHQEDMMEEYDLEGDRAPARPRRRPDNPAYNAPEDRVGRLPQQGRRQREPVGRDENEVMAEAIRLLQVQEGNGIGTPENPFGLPIMDNVHEGAGQVQDASEEPENEFFPVKPRKVPVPQTQGNRGGPARIEPAKEVEVADVAESDSLLIPMPDWMLFANRIVDDASTHDQIFVTPDKVIPAKPAVAPPTNEMPIVVVKDDENVAIQKRSFLRPMIYR